MSVSSVAAVLGLTMVTAASAQVIGSDFSEGADGWKTRDYFTGGSQSVPQWDGFAINTGDNDVDLVTFSAPGPKYTGNKLAYFGGTISFDLFDAFVSSNTSTTYTLAIGTGSLVVPGATVLHWYGGQPSTIEFLHFSAQLSPADSRWRIGGGPTGGGVAPTAEQFISVLSDITFIYVNADWHDGDLDFARLDNFTLAPVPEASLLFMLALGLPTVLLASKRRRLGAGAEA